MSRNLLRTDCYFCKGAIVLCEAPRRGTKDDFGRYYDEYARMTVANAECEDCGAEYLAWVQAPQRIYGQSTPCEGETHLDLSFRSTFDDEPGELDLPKRQVVDERYAVDADGSRRFIRSKARDCGEFWREHFARWRKAGG